ncbi:MAG: hypothetical protein ACOCWQ_05065 [Nanoarchaeota archaeon]
MPFNLIREIATTFPVAAIAGSRLFVPDEQPDMVLHVDALQIPMTSACPINNFQKKYWDRADICAAIQQLHTTTSPSDYLRLAKLSLFRHYYPGDFGLPQQSSEDAIRGILEERSNQWDLPDALIMGGNWFRLSESRFFSGTIGIYHPDSSTAYALEFKGSIRSLADQYQRFIDDILHSAPHGSTVSLLSGTGRTCHRNHSVVGRVQNNRYYLELPVPAHVYVYEDVPYLFGPTTVQIRAQRSASNYTLSPPEIKGNTQYPHPFVFSDNSICFNGDQRWQQYGVHFHSSINNTQEAARSSARALIEARSTLLNGYFNSPTPVMRPDRFPTARIPEHDIGNHPVHICS